MKQKFKCILFSIADLLVKPSSEIEPRTILLIRLDAIGDYVLFRNYIEILKSEYKDYRITLVGNVAWKSIAEEFDSNFIDNFVWINRRQFERNLLYRYKKLKEINKQGYEIVINPTYSRNFFADDSIVKLVNAKEKIGSQGDLSNIKKWQKNISDKFYTKLIPTRNTIIFEFHRNKEFFENLFDKKIDIKKPFIKLGEKKLNFDLPDRYAILFIGASASFRKWSIENFVEVGKFLKEEFEYEIVLCGGPTDSEDAKKFKELANYKYTDTVGKTSLLDLLYIIYNGSLMISNETSAPHFAVALGMTNIFVISNGNHFGRFIPYPKEIWPYYYPIYHPEIEKDLDNYRKLSSTYSCGSRLNINEISVEKVKEKVIKVLKRSSTIKR